MLLAYGIQNLANHLLESARYNDLHSLIDSQSYYAAKNETDRGGQQYAQDVVLSLNACETQLDNALNHKEWNEAEKVFPVLLAHSLLGASLRKRAGMSPSVLQVHAKLGKIDAVVSLANLMLDSQGRAETFYRIAEVLREQGQAGKAITILTRAAAIVEGSKLDSLGEVSLLQMQITRALQVLGERDAAQHLLDCFHKRLTRIWETGFCSIEAPVDLAKAFLSLGKMDKAYKLAKENVAHPLTHVRILCAVVSRLAEEGKLDEAHKELGQALKKFGDTRDEDTQARLVGCLAELGELDSAEKMSEQFSPKNKAYVLEFICRWALRSGDVGARVYLGRCFELLRHHGSDRDLVDACLRALRRWILAGRAEDINGCLQQFISEDPKGAWHASIAGIAADVGLSELALNLVPPLHSCQEGPLGHGWMETWAFAKMAIAFSHVGFVQGLDELTEYASTLEDSWMQSVLLTKLTNAWSQVGKKAYGQRLLKKVLSTVAVEEDEWRRLLALVEVIEVLQKKGEPSQAGVLLDQVLKDINKLEKDWERAWVQAVASGFFVNLGEHQKAVEQYRMAIETLSREEDPDFRTWAITGISRAVASLDLFDWQALAEVARGADIEVYAAEGLFSVSFAMAERGCLKEAWSMFKEAIETGLWGQVDRENQEHSWAVSTILEIDWNPTRAVGLLALISLLTKEKQAPRSIDWPDLVAKIPVEDPEAKKLAIETMIRSIDSIVQNRFEWMGRIFPYFRIGRGDESDTIWALVGVVLGSLTKYIETADVFKEIWRRLLQVDRLLRGPIGKEKSSNRIEKEVGAE